MNQDAMNTAAAEQKTSLPPDPDGMNADRATWAEMALETFRDATGSDEETAVTDLLADLMHYCDRNGMDFDEELNSARSHYEAETEALDEGSGAAA